jgi:hypothetical protein
MRQYRSRMSIGAAESNDPVQPPPTKSYNPRPTRFNVELPASPPPQASSIEAEFRRYTSGEVSSKETDMLGFWEVRVRETFQLNGVITQSLHRLIRMSFRRCLRSPWTISQSRRRLYLASACFRQRRRRTPTNETG